MPSVFTPLPPADVFWRLSNATPGTPNKYASSVSCVLTLLDMKYQAAGAHKEPLFCLLDEKWRL